MDRGWLLALVASLAVGSSGCRGSEPLDECLDYHYTDGIPADCAAKVLSASGYGPRAELERFNVYLWPTPVRPGNVLIDGSSVVEVSISAESWLFFVDIMPGALWQHPTVIALVDRRTGAIEAEARNSFPVLDGLDIFSTPDELKSDLYKAPRFPYFDDVALDEPIGTGLGPSILAAAPPVTIGTPATPDTMVLADNDPKLRNVTRLAKEGDLEYLTRAKGIYETQQSAAQADAELARCIVPPSCAGKGQKFALLIDGGRIWDRQMDKLAKSLRDRGYDTHLLSSDDDVGRTGTQTRSSMPSLLDAFNALAAKVTSCCDEVFIHIHAHGSPAGWMEINRKRTIQKKVGSNPDRFESVTVGTTDDSLLTFLQFRNLLNRIHSCQTKLYIHSCYSGSQFENGLNVLPAELDPGCLCRTVAVSSSVRQVTLGGTHYFTDKLIETGDFAAATRERRTRTAPHPDENGVMPDPYFHNQSTLVQATDCALCLDPDNDAIPSGVEWTFGTDAAKADTDGDGLSDFDELNTHKSDPLKKDTDGDTLEDGTEVLVHKTDPTKQDTDGDNLDDNRELQAVCDPNKTDTDGDMLPDGYEFSFTNTLCNKADTDDDGFSDYAESQAGTNPQDPASHP